MGRMINLTPEGMAGEGKRVATIKRKLKLGPISLNFVTLIIIALITLFYLAQTQMSTGKKSQIRDLVKEKRELQRDLASLEVEAAKARSMVNLEKKLTELNMVPIKKIQYFKDEQ